MITIQITNVDQLVLAKKGWFVANIVGVFVDMEAEVEAIVMERIRESLNNEGVDAKVERAPSPA